MFSRVVAGEQAGGEADPGKAERYEECEEQPGDPLGSGGQGRTEAGMRRQGKIKNTFL